MNLPTYSLLDSPTPTILNLSLAIPPPISFTSTVSNSQDHHHHHQPINPSSSPSTHPSTSYSLLPKKIHHLHPNSQVLHLQLKSLDPIQSHPTTTPSYLPSSSTSDPLDHHHPFLNHTGWDENFTTANSQGWVIYRTHPLRVIHRLVIPNSSLRIVLPVHRTNILYLVGGPPSPLYSPNKVILYDSSLSKAIFSIELSSAVLGLTARKDKLVVVLINRVLLFNVSINPSAHQISEQGHWDTCENPKGLACLASDFGSTLLVFPGHQAGKVQVVHLPPFEPNPITSSQPIEWRLPPYPSTSILVAHTTPLASLAITPSGNLIATASITGTLIRIWDVRTSALLRELRRGTDGAEIWGLRFRPDGLAVCASSDKGTIHVWSLADKPKTKNPGEEGKSNRSLALLKPYLPKYFHSTWSDAFFRLPPPGPSSGRSMPNLFAGLPIGSTSHETGEPSRVRMMKTRAESTSTSKAPTIEDDVSLVAWILADHPTTMTDRDLESPTKLEPQIVALTRSGGWFRLRVPQGSDGRSRSSVDLPGSGPGTSLPSESPQPTQSRSSTPTLHQASHRLGIGPDRSVELECVEYRRFGEDEDWSDEEDE